MAIRSFAILLRLILEKLGDREHNRLPPPVQKVLRQRETIDYSAVPCDGLDPALVALFKINIALVSGKQLWFRNEVERFWNRHDWKVCEIQDPCDPDPIRYAVLATIPYLLVRAFNANIELGLPRDAPPLWTYEEEIEFRARPKCFESVPDWTKKVPALATQLLLPNAAGHLPSGESDPTADPDMLRKNILTKWQPTAFI
jgi:hypothetical protein